MHLALSLPLEWSFSANERLDQQDDFGSERSRPSTQPFTIRRGVTHTLSLSLSHTHTHTLSLPTLKPCAVAVLSVFVVGIPRASLAFRALSGRLKFTVRRHKFNTDSLLFSQPCIPPALRGGETRLFQLPPGIFPLPCALHRERVPTLTLSLHNNYVE